MTYSPLMFVTAAVVVPLMVTCASLTARCDPASTTRPRIVPVCAPAAAAEMTTPRNVSANIRHDPLLRPKDIAFLLLGTPTARLTAGLNWMGSPGAVNATTLHDGRKGAHQANTIS
jgi:hypothetical protein